MITSLITQKNICAALGFVMAMTIVWKAKVETSLTKQTAVIEYIIPANTTDSPGYSNGDASLEFKKISNETSML
ncbi:MAG: hypothetical protein ABJ333_01615 [Algoriphagus sp.]|uniref:hypothetical protein n=1 Tax=Algoriphagus sp. TaxID=1872435 RepID=UPI0032781177